MKEKHMQHEHISKQFDAELETVRSRVLQMGGLVEEQIVNAIEALINSKLDLADDVIAKDLQVNAMEVEIDESCAHIIARRQPTAGDLRMVMTVIKTITDLERIGDEAEKIARMSKLIYQSGRLATPRFTEIKMMSGIVLEMLRKSLDAFARLDLGTAVQVPRQDILVDDAFSACMRHLITFMMEDPRTISTSLDVLFAAKAIERIGDHAAGNAKIAIMLGEEPPLKPLIDLPRMADKTADMLRRALDAFVKRDADAARAITVEDDEGDALYDQIFRELLYFMAEDPKTVSRATRLIWAAHNMERSADRVTNICERVVFVVTGRQEEIGGKY